MGETEGVEEEMDGLMGGERYVYCCFLFGLTGALALELSGGTRDGRRKSVNRLTMVKI